MEDFLQADMETNLLVSLVTAEKQHMVIRAAGGQGSPMHQAQPVLLLWLKALGVPRMQL